MPIKSTYLLLALALVLTAASGAHAFRKAPSWTLDLDLPPEQRFTSAVELVVGLHGWNHSFGPLLRDNHPLIAAAAPHAPRLIAAFKANFPERYLELTSFVQGMANVGHPEVNLTVAIVFPYFVELGHVKDWAEAFDAIAAQPNGAGNELFGNGVWKRACTGILSLPKDPSQPMLHGRNMDNDPRGKNTTLNITVVKGGKVLYHMFCWSWTTTGTMTGTRLGRTTVELNWNSDGYQTLEQTLARIENPKMVPGALMLRDVLEDDMTFENATEYLMTILRGGPAYIILSGPNRIGHVLTLQFNNSGNVKETLSDASNVTFMVQTNFDRWKPDPWYDPRRTAAEDALTMVGREVSGEKLGVWMALSTYPVHNMETIFSVLMTVEQAPWGYIRRGMYPINGHRIVPPP